MTRFSISDVKVDVHLNVLVFELDVLLRRFNRLSEIEKFPTLLAAEPAVPEAQNNTTVM